MDFKSFLTAKKPRRSNRLEMKKIENTVKHRHLGYFDILPLELKFHLLTYLSVDDLSILTITSKAMRNLIDGFKTTRPSGRHLLPNPFHHEILTQSEKDEYYYRFKQLGLLMKRSTCLYATKDRLKFVNDFLMRIICTNSKKCENPLNCIALICFGKFLHTVVAGWDDSECQRAFDSICLHTGALRNVSTILNSKPGLHSKMECDARLFFRRVFLDHCEFVTTRSFWLSCIFKSWPMVHQAKLLYLLYGPASQNEILWFEMCDNTSENCEESVQNLGNMANAIHCLYHYNEKWTNDNAVSVVDELTSFPDQWLSENIANLMLLCGDGIASRMLISKAINGRIPELSELMSSFCTVCVKNNFNINYVVSSLWRILEVMNQPKDRIMLLNTMMDMYQRLIMDLHLYNDPEVDPQNEIYYAVSAITELTKTLLTITFKKLLPE
ncbi:F-box only protein 47-like [Octopus sinensis]|uniref:F-box only protein 47-like n=1 Tax=Octopus sinensis TaxID=2607531 RepID=A0A7E6F107_9MOLL|nr:F-box only protein 47-like [Octopus sinensis]